VRWDFCGGAIGGWSAIVQSEKSIRYGPHDANVAHNDHPEHESERHLLGLMAKVSLAEQRTRPSSQKRHQMQSTLGYSTTALGGSPLIQPVGQEASKTHHGNDDP
jgi:hypothetical protein